MELKKVHVSFDYVYDADVGSDPSKWDFYHLLDIGPAESLRNLDVEYRAVTAQDRKAFEEDN